MSIKVEVTEQSDADSPRPMVFEPCPTEAVKGAVFITFRGNVGVFLVRDLEAAIRAASEAGR